MDGTGHSWRLRRCAQGRRTGQSTGAGIKADRFEPTLTRAYADFAAHYGITIVPARVRKPRDKKGAVEGAVKIVGCAFSPRPVIACSVHWQN
ncbi:MAG: hypothetical protein IPO08_15370 [Xanthomonadales bacterium]|nr:hypothetical protein [Xanthomonadales bacterium]